MVLAAMATVVAGKSHTQNASVLDPAACEVILRFFMPTEGRRVYNPFGGGVQFGFIAGAYGYEYVASELRENQCDANNKLCGEFPGVQWIQSDSSTYEPEGAFDLVFTCPPYYKVEHYVDYDGNPPVGELNTMHTYAEFRDALFAGYTKAIAHLDENRFFVVMTGDSRDSHGAYYCSEAETELFLRDNGLSVYNKIVYLECEFTRLAQAKTTLKTRKFPKCEQKIIVAYKGDMDEIVNLFPPLPSPSLQRRACQPSRALRDRRHTCRGAVALTEDVTSFDQLLLPHSLCLLVCLSACVRESDHLRRHSSPSLPRLPHPGCSGPRRRPRRC